MKRSIGEEYPELIAEAVAQGFALDRACKLVEEARQTAETDISDGEYRGERTILRRDLNTGVFGPVLKSPEAHYEPHLEMERRIRVGELVRRSLKHDAS